MYCVKCGVRLADTEEKCPLCGTVAYHPDIPREKVPPLYPHKETVKIKPNNRAVSGLLVFLFLIPLLVCLLADLHFNGQLDWFGYAAGGILLGYVIFALPHWFKRPNPVIFVPCDFAAAALYLLYVQLVTEGEWFLRFALPVLTALAALVCTAVALLRYLRGARLYIFGGGFIALGAFALLIELLLCLTFPIRFLGWSVYPLIVFSLTGGGLIFLAINTAFREKMERKFFF